MKKCKVCKTPFESFNSLVGHCSPKCGYELHQKNQDKKHKKVKAAFKEANKSKGEWKAEAQTAVNAYIRIRDHDKGCISCDLKSGGDHYLTGSKWDSGHYRSVGSASHMRFNTKNIFKQCVKCNRNLSGNAVEFRKRLVDRFGEDYVLAIEYDQTIRKFDSTYCKRIKKIFNKKARMKKKRLGL